MNSALKRLYCIAIIALLALSAAPIINAGFPSKVPPLDDVALWIVPVDIDPLVVGYTFNITVWAKANVETKGWQIQLIYNNQHLSTSASECWYIRSDGTASPAGPSEFMTEAGMITMPVTPALHANTPDANHNRLDFGEGWLSGENNSAKTGRCARIQFTVVQVPDKGETLSDWLDISTQAAAHQTYILGADGSYYYTAYDALYTFTWSPPDDPTLAVRPETKLFDRYGEWNCTFFDEKVVLEDLAALWYLTNVSFTLNYDPTELDIYAITKNTADWDVALTVDDTTTLGEIVVYAETSASPLSGDIDIITVNFHIKDQGLYPEVDVVPLTLTDVKMFDHTLEIFPEEIVDGEVTIEGFLAVPMAWMEVKPKDTVVGCEFVKHTTFQIEVTINCLHYSWKMIGVEFRLLYNDAVVKPVVAEEGAYLSNWADYGTWFKFYPEPDYYGPHVLVGNLILPNGTGYWNSPFPGDEEGGAMENGTIAIITFEIIEQLPKPYNLTGFFDLFNIRMVEPSGTLVPVDLDRVVNGTYLCTGFPWEGRMIDLYGGAVNAGYGECPFPAPYGGQGPNKPMDLVIPQSEVCLFTDVTYNYWPVQQKDVSFEVEGPYFHYLDGEESYYEPKDSWFILLKETARTDEDGVASITFAMPWPCVDPESLLGVYKVTATVNVRDVVIIDTLYFYYDYMVHIWKVTTDEMFYHHCDTVEITVEYGSHAMQLYPGLFSAVIKDELNVVIGIDLADVVVGGAVFCTYANDTVKLYIHVEKWAFAGWADILVNCYDKDPTEGGFAWTAQAFEDDIIYILPN